VNQLTINLYRRRLNRERERERREGGIERERQRRRGYSV